MEDLVASLEIATINSSIKYRDVLAIAAVEIEEKTVPDKVKKQMKKNTVNKIPYSITFVF